MLPDHEADPALELVERCEVVREVLSRTGDKWSVLVVMMLGDGPRRFNEMKRAISSISQRMLTLTLRGLERDGLVSRAVTTTTPPRVDYDLTPLGKSLKAPIEALADWAIEHKERVRRSRSDYDASSAGQPAAGSVA